MEIQDLSRSETGRIIPGNPQIAILNQENYDPPIDSGMDAPFKTLRLWSRLPRLH